MKKLLSALILIPLIGFSQNCELKKNEIDEFSKKKVVQTKSRILYDELARSVTVEFNLNEKLYIDLVYRSSSSKRRIFRPSDKVLFLLTDGSVVTCENSQFLEPNIVAGMNGPVQVSNFRLEITKEDLLKLKNIKIKTIRLENSDDPLDMVIKEKQTKRFYESLECFLIEI